MMYIAHIAWALDLMLVAAGFVALYFAAKEQSGYLKIAAWILIIGGAVSLGCSLYYSFIYWQQGMFATPMPMRQMNSMMPIQSPN